MSCRRVLRVSLLAGAPTVLLFVVLNAAPALAQGSARSLDIQPGARQNGLGAAGVALFGDPSDALWWNPAALGFADRTSAQYTHANLLPDLADIPYSHAAVATPLATWGAFGTSFTHLDYGESFGFESSPAIAIGVRVHPMVSVGASLKWVDVDLGGVTGSTFTSDIGALLRVERAPWTFGVGAMYQNFGGRVDFGNFGSSPPSRNYKVGVSATVPVRLSEDVTVGGTAVVDYNQSGVTDEFHLWNGGFEGHLTFEDIVRVAGRVGYYYDPLGDIEDFTIGGGIRAWMVAFDVGRIPQARGSGLDPVVKITAGIHVDLSAGKPSWRMD